MVPPWRRHLGRDVQSSGQRTPAGAPDQPASQDTEIDLREREVLSAIPVTRRSEAAPSGVMSDDASRSRVTSRYSNSSFRQRSAKLGGLDSSSGRDSPGSVPHSFAGDEELVGTELGNYRLVRLIGRGGMGRVYEAVHIRLERTVAIKVLRPERALRREGVARFFLEAQAVNRIRHRNIVDITDFVELREGIAFIVMELVQGKSLRELYKERNRDLPLEFVLDVMSQVCEGVFAAHCAGIVHRDLKPANIMVSERSGRPLRVCLLDFGLAKLNHRDGDLDCDAVRTEVGVIMGTPAYMSPEQALGGAVDARSDVYSLGAILYELVCRRRPVDGSYLSDFIAQHNHCEPTPPRQTAHGANIDPELEAIIMRCLRREPSARYATVADLNADLLAYKESAGQPRPAATAARLITGWRRRVEAVAAALHRSGAPVRPALELRHAAAPPTGVRERRLGSVGEQRLGSVGEQRLGSVGEQRLGSVGEQRLGSVGEQRLGSVGEQRLASAARRVAALTGTKLARAVVSAVALARAAVTSRMVRRVLRSLLALEARFQRHTRVPLRPVLAFFLLFWMTYTPVACGACAPRLEVAPADATLRGVDPAKLDPWDRSPSP
jgi:serine/threonine protein kinase